MRKALELALEALERSVATCFDQRSHDEVMGRPEHFVNRATTAIKESLAQPEQDWIERERAVGYREGHQNALKQMAQPEQEPVAWMDEDMDCIFFDTERPEPFSFDFWKPLYTTPPQRKPLTDEQMWVLWNSQGDDAMEQQAAIAFARAIEAAHGIKE